MEVSFLGAADTVTGSRYLIRSGKTQILVDCGLFQGYKKLRLRNWLPPSFAPSEIDAVILTHAHLDHSGYIPLLVKNGFRGNVYCTSATKDLCSVLLPDSGYLQEEEARHANKHGFSKHKPALPLYTESEAAASMNYFSPIPWKEKTKISKPGDKNSIEFTLFPAGHLFGAASVLLEAEAKSICFSGDLGRRSDPVTRLPEFNIGCDELVIESTYGNREHLSVDPQEELKEIILETFKKNGTLLIPSFAVGRAQLVLHYIRQLKLKSQIPDIPVFLNSPMAAKANEVFCRHFEESKMDLKEAQAICASAKIVASAEDSIKLNERKDPMIIIAASGMATGGRILHHLKVFGTDPKNTILFVGFQAGGTRGDAILNGAQEVKIHGEYWPIRAQIAHLDSMSAHADRNELLSWIRNLNQKPKRIFVTHGEPMASDELRRKIQEEFKIQTLIPEMGESFSLT